MFYCYCNSVLFNTTKTQIILDPFLRYFEFKNTMDATNQRTSSTASFASSSNANANNISENQQLPSSSSPSHHLLNDNNNNSIPGSPSVNSQTNNNLHITESSLETASDLALLIGYKNFDELARRGGVEGIINSLNTHGNRGIAADSVDARRRRWGKNALPPVELETFLSIRSETATAS